MSVQYPSIYNTTANSGQNTSGTSGSSGTSGAQNSIFDDYSSAMAQASQGNDRTERKMQQAKEDVEKNKEKLAKIQKEIKKLEKKIAEENRADDPNESKISDMRIELTKLKGKARTYTSNYQRALSAYTSATRQQQQEELFGDCGPSAFQTVVTAVENAKNNAVNKVQTAMGVDSNISIPSSEKASTLAVAAEGVANAMGSTGWCYRGVIRSLEKIGVTGLTGGSAYMAADQLAKRDDFQEITGNYPTGQSLQNLPAGAVVVWQPGVNGYHSVHGHISIALGDGRESSDHIQKQGGANYTGSTGYRVFMPK